MRMREMIPKKMLHTKLEHGKTQNQMNESNWKEYINERGKLGRNQDKR